MWWNWDACYCSVLFLLQGIWSSACDWIPWRACLRKVCLSTLLEVALVVKIFSCPSNPFERAAALIRMFAINRDTQSLSRGRIQAFTSKKGHQDYNIFLLYITPFISLCCFFQVCSVYLSTMDFTREMPGSWSADSSPCFVSERWFLCPAAYADFITLLLCSPALPSITPHMLLPLRHVRILSSPNLGNFYRCLVMIFC